MCTHLRLPKGVLDLGLIELLCAYEPGASGCQSGVGLHSNTYAG